MHETDSLTYWTVKRSIDFLETRDDTRPFFLWTSFTKPHPPYDPPANYWALYANKGLPAPVCGDWSEELARIPQGYMQPTYLLNNAYRLSEEQLLDVMSGVPQHEVPSSSLEEGKDIVSFLAETTIFPSKGEARKMIQNGGVSINRIKVAGVDEVVNDKKLLHEKYLLVQKGKKNYYLVNAK